jgi:hypothetical protein
VDHLALEFERVAGEHRGAHLAFFHAGKDRHVVEVHQRACQPAGGLRHAFDQQHAGHQRIAREMAFEYRAFVRFGYRTSGTDEAFADIDVDDTVEHLEVFKTHPGASGAFGGDQLVDAVAQVLQHEVLVRRRFAVVDFLSPLLKRQLDAKRLIDCERDIEEIETVDLEIVNGMAFRLNILTRDVASFRNDLSHFIKRRGHQARSLCQCMNWRRQ